MFILFCTVLILMLCMPFLLSRSLDRIWHRHLYMTNKKNNNQMAEVINFQEKVAELNRKKLNIR